MYIKKEHLHVYRMSVDCKIAKTVNPFIFTSRYTSLEHPEIEAI